MLVWSPFHFSKKAGVVPAEAHIEEHSRSCFHVKAVVLCRFPLIPTAG